MRNASGKGSKEEIILSQSPPSSLNSARDDREEVTQTLNSDTHLLSTQSQDSSENLITTEVESPTPFADLYYPETQSQSQFQPTCVANPLLVEMEVPSLSPEPAISQKAPPPQPSPKPVKAPESASLKEKTHEIQVLVESATAGSTAAQDQHVQLASKGDSENSDFKKHGVESGKEVKKHFGAQKPTQLARERHTERLTTGGGKEMHGLKITYWRDKEKKHHEDSKNEWKNHKGEKNEHGPTQDCHLAEKDK